MIVDIIIEMQKIFEENFAVVQEHFKELSFENMSKKELCDYYLALGKADACSKLMSHVCAIFNNAEKEEIFEIVKRIKTMKEEVKSDARA